MSGSETSSEADEQSASVKHEFDFCYACIAIQATTTDDAGSSRVQKSVAALLRDKLEATGQLNELKAQLRAAAYQALTNSEHMPNVRLPLQAKSKRRSAGGEQQQSCRTYASKRTRSSHIVVN